VLIAKEETMDWLWLLANGGAGAAGAAKPNPLMQMLPMMVIVFAVFYFIYMRPQMKQQKTRQAMLQALTKGDRVVTRGGLIGVIIGMKEKENIVVLRIGENMKVEVMRSAVEGQVQEKAKEEETKK